MTHKRYPEYKDSGVEWIGNVPEHWTVAPMKAVADIVNGATPDSGNPAYWDGDIAWFTPADLDNENSTVLAEPRRKITANGLASCAARLTPAGSVVLSTRAPVGSVGVASTPSATNQGCRTLVPMCGFPAELLAQMLVAARAELGLRSNGTTFQELSTYSLASLRIPVPSRDELSDISAALDRETTHIDALIAKKTRFIELLKEKRQALITHAVTNGLDPNVKMKDSGVEWIGNVPEHWQVIKFGRLARVVEGLVDPRIERYRSMPLFAPNHIESGTGRLLAVETAEKQNAESGKYLCKSGTVVYSKIRPALAKVIIAPEDGLCSADMYPLDCSDRVDPHWLFYLMLSKPFTAWAITESDRVAMPKINRESLSELVAAVPPVTEQRAIVAGIESKLPRIDAALGAVDRSIALVKERRSALINAAVTGQIDLREVA